MTPEQRIAALQSRLATATALIREIRPIHRDCFFLSNQGSDRARGLAFMERVQAWLDADRED